MNRERDEPDRAEAASEGLPAVEALAEWIEPEAALARLAGLPHCLLLESALEREALGRYSFLMADPHRFVVGTPETGDPLAEVESLWRACRGVAAPGLPPFQGGAAGLFGYDLGRRFEPTPPPRFDEFLLPELAIGFYDVVLAFDHAARRAWIISQGWPARGREPRRRRALERLEQFKQWLERSAVAPRPIGPVASPVAPALDFEVERMPGLRANFSPEGYREAVARVIEYIHAGDIFQANLSRRLLYPASGDALALYSRLRRANPAPFAGYFDLGDARIASASPERFLRVSGRRVEARPIKGTRRRQSGPEADLFTGDELRASEKDRAENVMIVDLMRNDLSRVCRDDSIHVSRLCGLEVYEYVQHLVSVVEGELRPESTPWDLIRAAFPGGSITGAPKPRAMEIIAELEPTARGAYCGSLGYIGHDGSMDLSILIRTITAAGGWWQLPVGGGVVAMSRPEEEYEETWHKAQGMLQALNAAEAGT